MREQRENERQLQLNTNRKGGGGEMIKQKAEQ